MDTARALNDRIIRSTRSAQFGTKFLDTDQDPARIGSRGNTPPGYLYGSANARDTEISAYVANAREFAAHMICPETLEGRNLGRGKAISKRAKPPGGLSPKEKAQGTAISLKNNVLPATGPDDPPARWCLLGRVARPSADNRTSYFLQQRRACIEGREQRSPSRRGIRTVMMAAAKMAALSAEAMRQWPGGFSASGGNSPQIFRQEIHITQLFASRQTPVLRKRDKAPCSPWRSGDPTTRAGNVQVQQREPKRLLDCLIG